MLFMFIYDFIVMASLTNFIMTLQMVSVSSALEAISPAIFELSIDKQRLGEGRSEEVSIDRDKFVMLLNQEIEFNVGFFLKNMSIDIYFYNVKTLGPCDEEMVVCDGVQIQLESPSLLMLMERGYRYEIGTN